MSFCGHFVGSNTIAIYFMELGGEDDVLQTVDRRLSLARAFEDLRCANLQMPSATTLKFSPLSPDYAVLFLSYFFKHRYFLHSSQNRQGDLGFSLRNLR